VNDPRSLESQPVWCPVPFGSGKENGDMPNGDWEEKAAGGACWITSHDAQT